ncbi:hypothetical protein [Ferrimonas marina]|uniref:hypothetical protein n=1 Tax=Ferrimonas marina TaxID=299255 RepID=UPI00116134E3|nr:hypothetical protein [Ferrimonas marina]
MNKLWAGILLSIAIVPVQAVEVAYPISDECLDTVKSFISVDVAGIDTRIISMVTPPPSARAANHVLLIDSSPEKYISYVNELHKVIHTCSPSARRIFSAEANLSEELNNFLSSQEEPRVIYNRESGNIVIFHHR